jgi:branched-chain amino acid transport system ATP-binding protein
MPIWEMPMLQIEQISCGYGGGLVLDQFSLSMGEGEVLCLLGRNGAGKTTTLKAIMGMIKLSSGRIVMNGVDVSKLAPHAIVKHAIAYVPQGRRLFAELTVSENLDIGLLNSATPNATRTGVLDMFPQLKDHMTQKSGTLSGGEQQMLAIARALCTEPKLLLLDEPTEGLMPAMITRIQDTIRQLKQRGVSVLLVEQRVAAALAVADRVAFVVQGKVTDVVDAKALATDKALIARHVGVSL